jgi:CRP-like cAMP-binding protein
MQASPPFSLGNWIVCGAHEGRVVDMTWRAVTIHTEDDNFILIPNATVAKADIINFHAPSTATARKIKVGLEYAVPPLEAAAVLEAAALESDGVLPKPAPEGRLLDFGDSAIIYELKFWINEPPRHEDIEQAVRTSVWYRLREKGLQIPFPIRTVEYVSLEKKDQRANANTIARRLRALHQVPLLKPLSLEQKQQLAAAANDILLAPNQILFRQNDAGNSFFVICHGSVDVLLDDPKNPSAPPGKVASLGAGEFFGEMSALTGQPRSATIRAASHFSAIQIEKEDLMEIFRSDPGIMEKISALVAQRTAELETFKSGPAQTTAADTLATQQKSLLSRMKRFFHLN